MTARRWPSRAGLGLLLTLLSSLAYADHSIAIDGSFSDWSSVTSCIADSSSDSTAGPEISNFCFTNDNASGTGGNLYAFFSGSGNFKREFSFGFFLDLDDDGAVT